MVYVIKINNQFILERDELTSDQSMSKAFDTKQDANDHITKYRILNATVEPEYVGE